MEGRHNRKDQFHAGSDFVLLFTIVYVVLNKKSHAMTFLHVWRCLTLGAAQGVVSPRVQCEPGLTDLYTIVGKEP